MNCSIIIPAYNEDSSIYLLIDELIEISNIPIIIIDDGSHDLSDQLKTLNYYYKYVKPGGYYVIEEYKFSNYFDHLNTNEDLNIEELINKVNKKEFFASKLIEKDTINLFLKKSKSIFTYKGNTRISDIAFFETNVD